MNELSYTVCLIEQLISINKQLVSKKNIRTRLNALIIQNFEVNEVMNLCSIEQD